MAFKNLRVIEMAGLAPGPMCGMILSDFGASVTQVSRVGNAQQDVDCLHAGKKRICIDMKQQLGQSIIKEMAQTADILIDPFRPGVMEKFNLGPIDLFKNNSRLIYARLTGYGQSGPMKMKAGHDINYMAMSGVLSMLGRQNSNPFPPINLLADFAGGGLICAFGISMALLSREKSGLGQVIDSSMVEGAAYVGQWLWRSQDLFVWGKARGHNFLDGGAHFYDTYETKDGKYMAVGALEPQFYEKLLTGLGLSVDELPQFSDTEYARKILADIFLTKSQVEWCAVFDNIDACVTPVLSMEDVALNDHNNFRKSFITSEEKVAPNPAPKLSSMSVQTQLSEYLLPGFHTFDVLQSLGYSREELDDLSSKGIISQSHNSKL